jgi:hypothetical protein
MKPKPWPVSRREVTQRRPEDLNFSSSKIFLSGGYAMGVVLAARSSPVRSRGTAAPHRLQYQPRILMWLSPEAILVNLERPNLRFQQGPCDP